MQVIGRSVNVPPSVARRTSQTKPTVRASPPMATNASDPFVSAINDLLSKMRVEREPAEAARTERVRQLTKTLREVAQEEVSWVSDILRKRDPAPDRVAEVAGAITDAKVPARR